MSISITFCLSTPLLVDTGCVHFLAIRNYASMNMCVQIFLQDLDFSCFEYIPRSRILEPTVILFLIL